MASLRKPFKKRLLKSSSQEKETIVLRVNTNCKIIQKWLRVNKTSY
jgi:hypothetical protein